MQTILIVIHLMVVAALVAVVLLQRSEGGALGIGGGGGFLTGRGQANALTRATAILAALFFATSLGLSMLASWSRAPKSIFENVPAQSSGTTQPGTAAPGTAAPGAPTPGAPGQAGFDALQKQLDKARAPDAGAPAGVAPSAPASPAAPDAPRSQ